MSEAQSNAQSFNALEQAIADAVAPPPPRPSPLRVQPVAGGRGDLWGPSTQRVTSPHQILAEVADHAQKLHEQMLSLVAAITGEAPPPLRLRQAPRPGGGLLPMVGLIAHLKGKVS